MKRRKMKVMLRAMILISILFGLVRVIRFFIALFLFISFSFSYAQLPFSFTSFNLPLPPKAFFCLNFNFVLPGISFRKFGRLSGLNSARNFSFDALLFLFPLNLTNLSQTDGEFKEHY